MMPGTFSFGEKLKPHHEGKVSSQVGSRTSMFYQISSSITSVSKSDQMGLEWDEYAMNMPDVPAFELDEYAARLSLRKTTRNNE